MHGSTPPQRSPAGCAYGLLHAGWQMAPGERAAIEGLLALVRPDVAVELGTADGGSLRRIACHSREVHSFDLAPTVTDPPSNATMHVGDSHVLLPAFLRELADSGGALQFALVDGDHSPAGVCRDVRDLLASRAVRRTCIVLHDTMNEGIRQGLSAIDFAAHPKVRFVDLAFVQLLQDGGGVGERWGGLGIILVDEDGDGWQHQALRTRVATSGPREALWRAAAPLRRVARRARYRLRQPHCRTPGAA